MLTEGIYLADRYEIVGKIGAGGMSDVYKAKDHTLGRFVAIKVLKQEFSEDVNFVTKFRTEAQSAAGLEHSNIVNIYDVGSENGIHYIVMEFVEGITLKTYIEKKGQLSYKEAISIAIQVGRGIEAAHNKHIIHRDIKPQNIIISTDGKVKVTDFGIARAANNQTIHSDMMGSVHYSSPEQARNGFVDGKSDIYSLGIVMYEMVTGRVPFDGDTTVSVAIQHLQEEMVVPSAYSRDLPISVEKIILKSTQKSQDRRYESISDLLLDLKKALISPDEDFVTMIPIGMDKTRVMQPEEVEAIKKETNGIYYKEAEEDGEEDEEAEDDEEEEGGFLNPKMEKAVTIMGIVAAVIIVAIIVYILGSVGGLFKFGGSREKEPNEITEKENEEDDNTGEDNNTEMVTMISLKGKTLEEARAELQAYGIGVSEAGREASDDYEEGQIIAQDIEEGEQVEKNSTVNVTISSGPGEFPVPNLVGNKDDAAIKLLEDNGLIPDRQFQYSNNVPEDEVISQEPVAGTMVKKGDTITFYVCQGSRKVKVPDVIGWSEEEARAELDRLGLKVETSSGYSDSVAEGCVIDQGGSEGEHVNPGSVVNLVISIGAEPAYYSFSEKVKAPSSDPDKSYEAIIVLYKSESDEIIPINGGQTSITVTSFPVTVTANDIKDCSSGTLEIIWYIKTEGEDGVEEKPEARPVTFREQ